MPTPHTILLDEENQAPQPDIFEVQFREAYAEALKDAPEAFNQILNLDQRLAATEDHATLLSDELKATESVLCRMVLQLDEANKSRDRALAANNEYLEQVRFLKRLSRAGQTFLTAHRAFEAALENGHAPTDAATQAVAVAECEFQNLIEEAVQKGLV